MDNRIEILHNVVHGALACAAACLSISCAPSVHYPRLAQAFRPAAWRRWVSTYITRSLLPGRLAQRRRTCLPTLPQRCVHAVEQHGGEAFTDALVAQHLARH